MRLISKCVIEGEAKRLARKVCGNVQLCAGLQAGIEGNLYAVREVWLESGGWTSDAGTEESPTTEQYTARGENGENLPLAEGVT